MPSASELALILSLQDHASPGLAQFNQHLGATNTASKAAAAGLAAFAAAGVGLAVGLGASITAAASFEQKMSAVKAVSNASAAEMGQLQGLALQLGKDTVFSAGQAAAGLEELVKGGVSVADIMGGAAKATLNLASAGGVELSEAAKIASNAMITFGLHGSDMARVTDLIAGAANASTISVQDFAFSLAAGGGTVRLYGGTIDDLTLSITAMGQQGLRGSDAGTSLKAMLNSLMPTTTRSIALMQQLGITTAAGGNAFFTAEGKMKDSAAMAGVLETATKGMTDAQRAMTFELLFGSDGMRAANALYQTGAEGINKLKATMADVTAEAVAAEKLNNLNGSLEQLKGSLETAAITAGLKFTPGLKSVVDAVTGMVNGLMPLIDLFAEKLSGVFAVLGEWGARIGERLKAGDIAGAFSVVLVGVNDLIGKMFGAGQNLIVTFANGILSGLGAVLDAVAEVVGQIAAFFIGSSPPAQGELSKIQDGGKQLVETYALGMSQANLGPVADIAARVSEMLTDLTGLGTIGKDVEGQLRMIQRAISDDAHEMHGLRIVSNDIKQSYADQIAPLQTALDLLQQTSDIERQRANLQDEITSNDLRAAEIAAMGDPVRRAQLQGDLDSIKLKQDENRLALEQQRIDDQRKDKHVSSEQLQALDLQQQELNKKKELAGLIDKEALAKVRIAQQELKDAQAKRKIQEDEKKLADELLRLPLQEQIAALKKEEQEKLKPIEEQLRIYQRQNDLLAFQSEQWSKLKGDIDAAVGALPKPSAGGGGGGGGGAAAGILAGLGERKAGAGGPLVSLPKLLPMHDDWAKDQGKNLGETLAKSMAEGINKWFSSNASAIIGGALGAILGGVFGGPLGAILGAVLGAKIGEALQPYINGLAAIFEAGLATIKAIIYIFATGDFDGALKTIGILMTAMGQSIAAILSHWGEAFVAWIGPRIGPMMAQLGDLAIQFLEWLGHGLVFIVENLAAWGAAFVKWVTPFIEPLLVELAKLMVKLDAWFIGTALPAIVKQLLTWADAFVKWVAPQIPPLLAELVILVGRVGNWATHEGKDMIIDAGKQLGSFMIQAMIESVKKDWETLLSTLASLISRLPSPPSPGLRGGNTVSDAGGEGRAAGGPVSSGRAYMVGETGPEMFVPGQSGNIVPNGGGVTININGAQSPGEIVREIDAYFQRRSRLARVGAV